MPMIDAEPLMNRLAQLDSAYAHLAAQLAKKGTRKRGRIYLYEKGDGFIYRVDRPKADIR